MKKIASILLVLGLVSGSVFGAENTDKTLKVSSNTEGKFEFLGKAYDKMGLVAAAFAAGFLVVVASDNGTTTTHTAATHH